MNHQTKRKVAEKNLADPDEISEYFFIPGIIYNFAPPLSIETITQPRYGKSSISFKEDPGQ